jgi:DNA-binding NarL/FixJ family response regulator
VSKKRPSPANLRSRPRSPPGAYKSEPAYWRTRVFKNTYTSGGKLRQTRNWCVKIQHLGLRRTLSLLSRQRAQAATEACQLYCALRKEGWDSLSNQPRLVDRPQGAATAESGQTDQDRLHPAYWAQRLVRREYTMQPQASATREFSARIDYHGTGYYFPLGTSARGEAAARALRIYGTVASQGWKTANQRFPRELTVAFRWLDGPLAWTYTTIHTQVRAVPRRAAEPTNIRGPLRNVAVIESDPGIRRSLAWCISHMEGFRCAATFATSAEALRASRRHPPSVAQVSSHLVDKPGAVCLTELKAAAPSVAGVLYSTYEDSEELFRSTPGGATNYLLQRTPSTRFLGPLTGALGVGKLTDDQITAAVWQYFKNIFAAPPTRGFARLVTDLTQRELEVLTRLSQGSPDKDIAERLGISIHTVHEHVRNIFEKLGVHNRTEAVVKFLQK